MSELIRTVVLQYCPDSNYAAGIAAAAAASHVAVRTVWVWRRRALRPIRLLGRVIRGLTVYAVVIAAGWIVLTAGLQHHP